MIIQLYMEYDIEVKNPGQKQNLWFYGIYSARAPNVSLQIAMEVR